MPVTERRFTQEQAPTGLFRIPASLTSGPSIRQPAPRATATPRSTSAPAPAGGGGSATFFDPYLAELQRQLQHEQATGTADLQLRRQRLDEDMNLMRPFMESRFGQQLKRTAGDVAGRGFHGAGSGIMRSQLGNVAEEQAFARGQFERQGTREAEDIERAIAALTARTTMAGAEGVRQGAGNATGRAIQALPF